MSARTSAFSRLALAAACAFGILSVLAVCAANGMGFLHLSPAQLVGLVVALGLMVVAGLMMVLDALSLSYRRHELLDDDGLSTLTLPPAPLERRKQLRRHHLTLVK